MRRLKSSNDGSTLVLLVIIIAFTAVLGISILNISMNNYKIKKSNNELKKAFYISEDGLNKAYLRIYDLICEASEDSVEVADDYLIYYPEDYSGASGVCISNYKLYILSCIRNRVFSSGNPRTEVIGAGNLVFINDKLMVRVKSKYLSDSGIEKSIVADIIILVPDFNKIKSGETDLFTLLFFNGFDI